jgi:hypothetical protein
LVDESTNCFEIKGAPLLRRGRTSPPDLSLERALSFEKREAGGRRASFLPLRPTQMGTEKALLPYFET